MPNPKLLPAFMLAAIMLTGCKDPVGLQNQVRAASRTVYCHLDDSMLGVPSGYLDGYAGYMTPDSAIDSFSPTIKRGYVEYQRRPYPRTIGYAVFRVPEFDATTGVVVCTLCYYQSAHSGYPDLEVRNMGITMLPTNRSAMFWGAWDSDVIMAEDVTHASNGWCKVALTGAGDSTIIFNAPGGAPLYTGWVYDGLTSDIYTEVYGAASGYEPYIKVVVTN